MVVFRFYEKVYLYCSNVCLPAALDSKVKAEVRKGDKLPTLLSFSLWKLPQKDETIAFDIKFNLAWWRLFRTLQRPNKAISGRVRFKTTESSISDI